MPINAISLSANSAVVTAIANDYGYEKVFSRQVLAHGRAGGALIAISTSGRSANVLNAASMAKEMGMKVIAFTGGDPVHPAPELVDFAHLSLIVDSVDTPTIQEAHKYVYHKLCEELEKLVIPGGDHVDTASMDSTDSRIRHDLLGGPHADG